MTKLSGRVRERVREESQEDIKDSQTLREEKKGDEFNKKKRARQMSVRRARP